MKRHIILLTIALLVLAACYPPSSPQPPATEPSC